MKVFELTFKDVFQRNLHRSNVVFSIIFYNKNTFFNVQLLHVDQETAKFLVDICQCRNTMNTDD